MKNITFLVFLLLYLIFGNYDFLAQNNTNSNEEIKQLIAKKRSYNNTFGYGYRIQIYYGNETKARSLQDKFKITFPNVFTKLDYNKPDWKVLVGNYKTKLEADKATINFSEKFEGLIVIPLGK